jgi:hypothetical protein
MNQPLFTREQIDQDFPEDEELDEDEYDFDEDDDEEPEDEVPVGVSPDDPHAHDDAPILTWEQLQSVDDTAAEKLYIKEWGGNVLVKGISMEELNHVRRLSGTKHVKLSGTRSDVINREILIAGMVQPAVTKDTFPILQQRSAGAVIKITDRILEKSGMDELAEKARERRFPRKR